MPVLVETLAILGLSAEAAEMFDARRRHSQARVHAFKERVQQIPDVTSYPNLAVYASGSHARSEASEFSDIDLFFIHDDRSDTIPSPRLKALGVMAGIADGMNSMGFPPPSNDGEYLNILSLRKILEHLGGAEDDHLNHFTARMLLILESVPIYGDASYNAAVSGIFDAYLRDYEDHASEFRPTFLVNDILRFWKTLCLNYENRRNQADQARKVKQKIRNFKLGFSRLLTCFATVGLLSSYNNIDRDTLVAMAYLAPIERLLRLHERMPAIRPDLVACLELYHWFLQQTAQPTADLEAYFGSKAAFRVWQGPRIRRLHIQDR